MLTLTSSVTNHKKAHGKTWKLYAHMRTGETVEEDAEPGVLVVTIHIKEAGGHDQPLGDNGGRRDQ